MQKQTSPGILLQYRILTVKDHELELSPNKDIGQSLVEENKMTNQTDSGKKRISLIIMYKQHKMKQS